MPDDAHTRGMLIGITLDHLHSCPSALLAQLVLPLNVVQALAMERPNILLIMTDQQRWDSLGR